MATKNHQKSDGAAKRSGHTTRSRSLAAIVAGATLSGALAAGGALGFIGEAKAITALSGTTFLDLNGNGQLDAAPDRLIGGVTVTAFDSSGANAGQVVSESNGTWQMAANGSGPYRIEFSNLPKSTYEGFNTQVTNLQFSNSGASFGLYAKLNGLGEIDDIVGVEAIQIGDRVWADNNSNGIQDQGEPGIEGVVVELLIDGGPYIENGQARTSTTNGNGNYVFSGIPSNRSYSVRIAGGQAPLANYVLTAQNSSGSTRYNDSDAALVGADALAIVVAPKAGADMSYDFGYKAKPVSALYCVGDQVWEDTNKDGLFNNGEPGIGGVNVTLIDNAGNPVAGKSAVTASNGTWNICDLPNGDYRVRFTKPDGYEFTKQAATANDGQSSADANGVSLPGTINDKNCVCLDAGLIKNVVIEPKVSLGDTVWLDANRDGIKQENESTLAGYTVTLLDQNGNPVAGVGEQVTGENGQYLFTNLNKGSYRVRFTRPAGSVNTPTTSKQGGSDITDSDAVGAPDNASATTDVINLQADNRNVDSGWLAPVAAPKLKLGDLVFIDTDRDGRQTAVDTPVSGATVRLLNEAGTVIATTTTDASGKYLFTDLAPGKYQVQFTRPAGTTVTPTAVNVGDRGTTRMPVRSSKARPSPT
jgi:serine-aspartate repeat-containing protein C/D/E